MLVANHTLLYQCTTRYAKMFRYSLYM